MTMDMDMDMDMGMDAHMVMMDIAMVLQTTIDWIFKTMADIVPIGRQ